MLRVSLAHSAGATQVLLVRKGGGCSTNDVKRLLVLEKYHKTKIFALPGPVKRDLGFSFHDSRLSRFRDADSSQCTKHGRVHKVAALIFAAKNI
jgi:hypothetical protein